MRRTAKSAVRLLVAASLAAAPVVADDVLVLRNHTDEMSMMGVKTPAQDVDHEYWFGDEGTRFDAGETSVIVRVADKQLIFVNHGEKSFSRIDLPFTFEKLVPPEMAPMMEMMAKTMAASTTVTASDRKGSFAGIGCDYAKVTIDMNMMQMAMDVCATENLPVDLDRYRSLQAMQAEMAPNMAWVKDLAEKLKGFPLRSDTATTVMGKTFLSWSELKSVEKRTAPAGHYGPPTGYKEVKFDPMSQMQQQGRKRK